MSDVANLVRSAAAGDTVAFGRIYDEYAPRVFTVCRAILRDDHEAEDVMQDVFVTAGARLHQLRDPDKLGSWLYAIARHRCFRRAKQRNREQQSLVTNPAVGVADSGRDPDAFADAAAAGALVWEAAAGLTERDRMVLEAHIHGGLEGEALALALGTTAANAYVWLSRAKDQLERCVVALVIARDPERNCDGLATVLEGWDGELDPLLRKRLHRHIEKCETCSERKRRAAGFAAYGALPLSAAPISCREQILDRVRLGPDAPTDDERWKPDGFPPDDSDRDDETRPLLLAGIAALVLTLLVGGVVLALVARPQTERRAEAVGDVGAVAPDTNAGPAASAGGGASTTGPAPGDPTSTSLTGPRSSTGAGAGSSGGGGGTAEGGGADPQVPPDGRGGGGAAGSGRDALQIVPTQVDLGPTATSSVIVLTNRSAAPVTWSAVPTASWITVSTPPSTLAPNASVNVTIDVSRAGLPDGTTRGGLVFRMGTRSVDVPITVTAANPPQITGLEPTGDGCNLKLEADVSDQSKVKTVSATAVITKDGDPNATTTVVTMKPASSGSNTYGATLSKIYADGTVTWTVTATDELGAVTPPVTARAFPFAACVPG